MNLNMTEFSRRAGIVMILALSINCAQAGDHGDRNDRAERREARAEQRQHDRAAQQQERQAAAAVQAPMAVEAPPEVAKKPGRMTPEERRALRRQINEAGQDIYGRKN